MFGIRFNGHCFLPSSILCQCIADVVRGMFTLNERHLTILIAEIKSFLWIVIGRGTGTGFVQRFLVQLIVF